MQRFLLSHLIDWKHKKDRKPLIIRGARQVGKTYLIRDFAKHHFANLIEVNFERTPILRELFQNREPQKILTLLQHEANTAIIPGQTLLFLDEIQAAPEVIALLRYFYEDCPDVHVIAAGSLLDFALEDPRFSTPVGRVEYAHLGPMSFEEVLLAAKEEGLKTYLSEVVPTEPIPTSIHDRLMAWVRTYCRVGGMPQVVSSYLDNPTSTHYEQIQHAILATYQNDFGKYGIKVNQPRLKRIFEQIPQLIGEKIKYVNIDPNERAKDVNEGLTLLEMAKVCTRVYHTSGNGLPLGAEQNEKIFKLLFLDIGLMSIACGLNRLDLETVDDLTLVNQGKISEQFVGTHLLYRNPPYIPPRLHYWIREEKSSSAEVDYLIAIGSRIIPVEIKSGKTGTLKSLQLFLHEKKGALGIRVSTQALSVLHTETAIPNQAPMPFTLLSVPFYLVEQIERLVKTIPLTENIQTRAKRGSRDTFERAMAKVSTKPAARS